MRKLSLPAFAKRDELVAALKQFRMLIIVAATGLCTPQTKFCTPRRHSFYVLNRRRS